MKTIRFARYTDEEGARVSQVLVGGMPTCKPTTFADAGACLRHEIERTREEIHVVFWDNDTQTERTEIIPEIPMHQWRGKRNLAVWVYGVNQDGTLRPVAVQDVYSTIDKALSGYRAYERERAFVEGCLKAGNACEASWDGNRYAFSPFPLA